jgi:transcriptional regulator with PAS, ATPase and Fis domain
MAAAGSSDDPPTLVLTSSDGGVLVSRRWTIEVVEGPDRGRSITRDSGIVVVGTHSDADLMLSDGSVSRFHAELQLLPEGVMVVDLKSTNGTRIGRVSIERGLVPPGETVRVGHTRLLVRPEDRAVAVADQGPSQFGAFVTTDPTLRKTLGQLVRVAASDSTVLFEAETGTGKELLARAIHAYSTRQKQPFVTVDCAAMPETLLESELFGALKGSFTGADADRIGAFEAANGGTVFLDELGEFPLALQPKLLRVLESRTVRRIGEVAERPINVRFVAATNKNLAEMAKAGTFRPDLYYRVAVVRAKVPPLRDRLDDIPLLAGHFSAQISHGSVAVSAEANEVLRRYDWPGNARELRNLIERAIALESGPVIKPSDLFPSALDREADASGTAPIRGGFQRAKNQLISDFERRYVRDLLARHEGNVSSAAREAGLSRPSLYALMKRVGVSDD